MQFTFELVDTQSVEDLRKFLARAIRMDAAGQIRLRAFGDVLTAFVAPLFVAEQTRSTDGGLTVLGLRTIALATPAEFDVALPIAALDKILSGEALDDQPLTLGDRLERLANLGRSNAKATKFVVDDSSTPEGWIDEAVPRSGWIERGALAEPELTKTARDGVAEVTTILPTSVGGPIAARIRAEIWSRPIDYTVPVPAGAAFVAAGLGFLTEGEIVPWFMSGDWIRLSSEHGHVLAHKAHTYLTEDEQRAKGLL
jgi:hypothetical protein